MYWYKRMDYIIRYIICKRINNLRFYLLKSITQHLAEKIRKKKGKISMGNYNDFDLDLHQIKSNASVGAQSVSEECISELVTACYCTYSKICTTSGNSSAGCSASDMTACDVCEEAVNSKAARC